MPKITSANSVIMKSSVTKHFGCIKVRWCGLITKAVKFMAGEW